MGCLSTCVSLHRPMLCRPTLLSVCLSLCVVGLDEVLEVGGGGDEGHGGGGAAVCAGGHAHP